MELGRRVNHRNVVRTAAAGDVDDVHYLAAEFVPGKTLRQGGQGERVRCRWGTRRSAVARTSRSDSRTSRTRVDSPRREARERDGPARRPAPVLLDLGLCLRAGRTLPADPAIAGGGGYVVGAMDYLALEQARNAVKVGPAADLYGLGCTLYFALTG